MMSAQHWPMGHSRGADSAQHLTGVDTEGPEKPAMQHIFATMRTIRTELFSLTISIANDER